MGRFSGKRALVTGGTSGIGLAAAELLHREGARVMVTGRSEGGVASARAALPADVVVIASDTRSVSAVEALAETVKVEMGGLDALLACAGQTSFVSFEDTDEATYDRLQAVNARGPYFTVQKLAPLVARGGGIVVVTSVAHERGFPMISAYAASKAALRSMVRSLARELVVRDIRVNAVSPGPIDSGILEKALPPGAVEQVRGQMTEANPMRRFGRPEEVAAAMAFLAFEATYTTGAELVVDGGATQF